jgi:hypothetical protein
MRPARFALLSHLDDNQIFETAMGSSQRMATKITLPSIAGLYLSNIRKRGESTR